MAVKASHTSEFSKSSESSFSSFGHYYLKDEIRLNLPNTTIVLNGVDSGKFSYFRSSGKNITKKIIQTKSSTPQLELAPVLPIHTPSYKTDFFFFRLTEPVFIAAKSALETTVPFPIEIGIFLVEQDKSVGIDFFSCDPINSRFGLYGTPEDGKLCKYATISLSGRHAIHPFINAQFRIKIANDLEEAVFVGKIVFPITDHDLYYHNNEIDMDGLNATVKNRVGFHIIETVQNSIAKSSDWIASPRSIEKTDYKFSMDRGFD